LDPHFGQNLATFLQHLQDVSTLRHLVLTLPCTPPAAAAALGKVTQLQSLRMCIDVCHSSELMLRQDTGALLQFPEELAALWIAQLCRAIYWKYNCSASWQRGLALTLWQHYT
jgi:hypothetical protein